MSDIDRLLNEKGQIDNQSLSEKAATILRHQIITGKYSQGQKIREAEISKHLGISRLSIREAFLQLEQEGLLVKEKNRFTKIVEFSLQDIKEIYSLRNMIECMCVEILLEGKKIPEKELRDIILKLDEIYELKPIDSFKWLEMDFAFHEIIVAKAGHSRAISIWGHLKNQIKFLLFPVLTETPLVMHSSTDESHTKVVDAMMNGDVKKTTELLKEHILSGSELVIHQFTSKKLI